MASRVLCRQTLEFGINRSIFVAHVDTSLRLSNKVSAGETTKPRLFSTHVIPARSSRRLYGATSTASVAFDAVLVDVGGTLLHTAEPVPELYAGIGRKYGVTRSPEVIKSGFKRAFAAPWPERLRYEGDGRSFWRFAVAEATGVSDETYFEELYSHYGQGQAWTVAEGAREALGELKGAGVKLAVVSNFDSRLRRILAELHLDKVFDAVIVSSEVGFEKPSPEIFAAALERLGVPPSPRVVHVGDDAAADVEGARAVGLTAWLWKKDINSFEDIVNRTLPQRVRGDAK